MPTQLSPTIGAAITYAYVNNEELENIMGNPHA
jgi:hypothetical protein